MEYRLEKEITEKGARTKYGLYNGEGRILKLDLPFNLEVVDKDIAVFNRGGYYDSEDIKKAVIFDLARGKVICDRFNKIYAFQDFQGEKRAQADIYVRYNNIVVTFSCFIDIHGNIVSKVIDNRELIPFEASMLDKHIEYVKKCLVEEEKNFTELIQNEKEKMFKLVLHRK